MQRRMTSCFRCGEDEHIARDCPHGKDAAKTPPNAARGVPVPWCSWCDETTRLVDLGYAMQRCTDCHPLRFQSLPQSRKCPNCNATVYEWDHGCHSRPGEPLPRPATKGRPESTRPGHDRAGKDG
jgi:hypothetical protein